MDGKLEMLRDQLLRLKGYLAAPYDMVTLAGHLWCRICIARFPFFFEMDLPASFFPLSPSNKSKMLDSSLISFVSKRILITYIYRFCVTCLET